MSDGSRRKVCLACLDDLKETARRVLEVARFVVVYFSLKHIAKKMIVFKLFY